MADLGGAHPARAPPPPFETFFYICPPFWNLTKKKMCRNTEMCWIPPPPPPRLGLARLSTLVALRKKKCRSPPPLISFFGTCATFDFWGWRRSEKKQSVLCPPFCKILDPPLVVIITLWSNTVFGAIITLWKLTRASHRPIYTLMEKQKSINTAQSLYIQLVLNTKNLYMLGWKWRI